MRLLLDTHVLLWVLSDDRRLTPRARGMLRGASAILVSAVSAWEVAIKVSLGKLVAPTDLESAVVESGLIPVTVDFADVAELARLPLHHTDPFDRMLVAQARVRDLTLVTRDRRLRQYDVPVSLV